MFLILLDKEILYFMNYDYNNSEGVAQAVTLVTYATSQLLWQKL